jgi:DNA-binding response OmpR family regulator
LRDAGAADYLTKPINVEQLLAILAERLRTSELSVQMAGGNGHGPSSQPAAR